MCHKTAYIKASEFTLLGELWGKADVVRKNIKLVGFFPICTYITKFILFNQHNGIFHNEFVREEGCRTGCLEKL